MYKKKVLNYLSSPLEVTLELTNLCNLHCIYCYADAGKQYPNELKTEEWKDVIDELADMKVFSLFFGGGEPLLRVDFFELAKHAISKGLAVGLSTNGLLLNGSVITKLKKAGVEPIQISIDGIGCVHDFLRGRKGSFRKIVKAMNLLKNYDVPFQLSMTLTSINYHQIRDVFELAKRYRASALFLSDVMPSKKLGRKYDYFALTDGQRNFITKISKELAENQDEIFVVYMNSKSRSNRKESAINIVDSTFANCGAGRVKCVIDAKGDVFPCELVRFNSLKAGNVREQPFNVIWKESRVFKWFRKTFKERKCSSCDLLFKYKSK